jgi:hypothetical protein
MARLVLVELRRALSRGITKLLTAAGVIAILAVGLLVFLVVRSADTLRAEARALYDRSVSVCTAQPDQYATGPRGMAPGLFGEDPPVLPVPGAGRAPAATGPQPGTPEARRLCERLNEPVLRSRDSQIMDLVDLWPGPPSFGSQRIPAEIVDLPPLFGAVIMLPTFVLLAGAVVAGASMVGAEWQARSLVTLLTWEPRRSRLLAARMIAVALVGAAIALALLALFTLVLWFTARAKGEVPTDPDWWVTYGGVVLRLSGLVGLTAVVGAALAMIGKRTALAVFAIPVYLIGAEIVVRLRWEAARPWLVLRNFILAVGGDEYLPDAGTAGRGLTVLLGWSALVIALAFVAFSRRDFASSG